MRSLLFVPGDRPERFAKAAASGADAVILDLEDAVTADRRGGARIEVARHLASVSRAVPQWVRINPVDSADALADLTAVIAARPDGILLPKPESLDDLWRVDHWLEALEAANGISRGAIAMLPIVTEKARAVLSLGSWGRLPARVAGLTWGAEDLAADIGAEANRTADGAYEPPFLLARSLCLLAAGAAGVPAYDTIDIEFRDPAAIERRSREARRLGFLRADRHPPGADRADPQGLHTLGRGDQLGGARTRGFPLVPGPRCGTARRPHARHAAHAAGRAHPRQPAGGTEGLTGIGSPVMSVIESSVDRGSAEFAANAQVNRGLAEKLRALIARVEQGGSAAARAQHEGRGKMFVRDRVDRLLDAGSPFLEIGAARGARALRRLAAGRRRRRGDRARGRHRVRDRRERRDGEGRDLLPDHRQEAPARAGDRARQSRCRAFTSSTPAAPFCRGRTRCFPTAITSAGSSTTRRRCPVSGSRRSPS